MHRTFPRRCASFVPSRFLDHKEYVMMKANLAANKDQLGPLDSVALHLLSNDQDVKIDFGILQLNALALDCHKSTHQSQSGVKELMEKQNIKKGRYTIRDAEKIQSNFVSLTPKIRIMKILQRKNQGFCPSTARKNLTIAPIDLNFFLK